MNKKYTDLDHLRALTWAKKIRAIKVLGCKCEICCCDDIFVMEFHHKYGKDHNVSNLLTHTNSQIDKEISKCILLCRNCHAELHHPNSSKAKELLLKLKGIDKCMECGYRGKSFASLDFHHRNPKNKLFAFRNAYVSSYTSNSRLLVIKKEMKKCDIICKNCHIEKQINMKRFNRIKPLIDYKLVHHIEHSSPQPNREQELKIKNSEYRNSLAKWLRTWRKYKTVKKASEMLGVKNNMLSANLMQSKVYRKIRHRISKPTSQYKGVYWDASRQKWAASSKVNGKSKSLGRFDKEVAARDAYLKFKRGVI